MEDFEFDTWLKKELKQRRMTQKELAYRSGIEPSTISNHIVKKTSPTLRTFMAILDALHMEIKIVDSM